MSKKECVELRETLKKMYPCDLKPFFEALIRELEALWTVIDEQREKTGSE